MGYVSDALIFSAYREIYIYLYIYLCNIRDKLIICDIYPKQNTVKYLKGRKIWLELPHKQYIGAITSHTLVTSGKPI